LPSEYQGVQLRRYGRSGSLSLESRRLDNTARRRMLDRHGQVNATVRLSAIRRSTRASPRTKWRIACKTSVPELTDLSKESETTLEMYGRM